MNDQQPTSIRGAIPVGGRLFCQVGWERCPPIGTQMGILHIFGIVCPRKRQKRVLHTQHV